MKIIQSFWSKPIRSKDNSDGIFRDKGGWSERIYFYMSWTLSCLKFKEIYGNIELITDKYGKELLCDILELPFTSVKVELNCLDTYNHNLWALGKIYSYSVQDVPFLHVDNDIFVWDKFPEQLLNAGLICQNLEVNYPHSNEYFLLLEDLFEFIPESIRLLRKKEKGLTQINAGILGGNNISFIKEYAKKAFEFIERNESLIDKIPENKGGFNMVFEQYLFYALAKEKNIPISTLFSEHFNRFEGLSDFHRIPNSAYYIHALGTLKKLRTVGINVAERLLIEYPEYYSRIIQLYKNNLI